jgi:hypothetical protein
MKIQGALTSSEERQMSVGRLVGSTRALNTTNIALIPIEIKNAVAIRRN